MAFRFQRPVLYCPATEHRRNPTKGVALSTRAPVLKRRGLTHRKKSLDLEPGKPEVMLTHTHTLACACIHTSTPV